MRQPQVGVGIIVWKGEQLLLLRRSRVHGDGTWSTPGGHLEPGEGPESCAIREVLEETGVEVGNVRFLAITNDVFVTEARHYLTVWMEGEWVSGEARVAAEYEASEVGWFSVDALPDNLFLSLQNLVDGVCYPAELGGIRGRAV